MYFRHARGSTKASLDNNFHGDLTLARRVTMCFCRYPTDQVLLYTSFKSKQVAGRASMYCHIPYDSGSTRRAGRQRIQCL
jgi:hypothetical protein